MNKRDGITAQFIRLLVFAGLGSLLLFATSRLAFRFALTAYVDQTNFIQRETARQLEEFQTFVTEENLSSKDVRPITDWVQKHNLTLLELYRDHVLVYSSFAPGKSRANRTSGSPSTTGSPMPPSILPTGTLKPCSTATPSAPMRCWGPPSS